MKVSDDPEKDAEPGSVAPDFHDTSSETGSDSSRRVNTLNARDDDQKETSVSPTAARGKNSLRCPDMVLDQDLEVEEAATAAAEGSIGGIDALSRARTGASAASAASRPPDFEVVFEPGDLLNPKNWPLWYRGWVIFCVSFSTWVVVLYSTDYTASIYGLMIAFGTDSETVVTLGITTYLVGLAIGGLLVAPLSELYGRRPVYLVAQVGFVIMLIPAGLATSLTEILVVRFFGALFASAMVANSPGTVVDIADEEYRALCMSLWSIAPLNGPVSGPLIGGFVYQYLGWRWDNWLVMILGGVSCFLMATVKETYAPTLLRKKAAQARKENEDDRWWCRYDEKISKLDLIKINLSRPFVLAFTEPILWFFNLWISLVYGILYLSFVAYPIIFSQYRGWGPGITGLAFSGIGIGTTIAIACEPLWRRIINRQPKDPETGGSTPEATAIIMLIGAIMTPLGQLVFSWTSLPVTIHWAISIAAGIPFGLGNTLIFIYGSSYLAGAYGIYAASALAGNAVTRSFFGGTLPLAGPAMYAALTPQWAGTLLGLLEVLLIPIPIVFFKYGAQIRAKSTLISQMKADQAKNASRRAKYVRKHNEKAVEKGLVAPDNGGVLSGHGVGASKITVSGREKDEEAVF